MKLVFPKRAIVIGIASIAILTLGFFFWPRTCGQVDPGKLACLIRQADKIVVYEGPMDGSPILFISTNPKDIAEFNDALNVIRPKTEFSCACFGTPAVRLYKGNSELALITNHHGFSVRCSLWESDAELKDSDQWLKWFDKHNIPGPRREYDDSAERAKKAKVSYQHWIAAMPKSIGPLWNKANNNPASVDVTILRPAIIEEFSDPHQRALALFSWYGSGAGPWSGYPSYEHVAEKLLFDISIPELIAAAEEENLTEAQLEGAARLFGGWEFSRWHAEEQKLLPAALKKRLLDHSMKSSDEDKLGRAHHAFAEP